MSCLLRDDLSDCLTRVPTASYTFLFFRLSLHSSLPLPLFYYTDSSSPLGRDQPGGDSNTDTIVSKDLYFTPVNPQQYGKGHRGVLCVLHMLNK